METLEVNAGSVDEAVDLALQQLGAKLSEVEIVVLTEGRAGILGVGAEDARIRVTKLDVGRSRMSSENFPPRPPAITYASQSPQTSRPVMDDDDDEDEDYEDEEDEPAAAPEVQFSNESRPAAKAGREILEGILSGLGFRATLVETAPPIPVPATSDITVAFDVRGRDLGLLIGRRGQTLASIQFVVNMMVNRKLRNSALVVVDVEGYRARRYQALRTLAERMADRVRRNGQPITLEPMNASERRIIHMTLQDYQDVATQSVGEGENRKVTVIPKRAS